MVVIHTMNVHGIKCNKKRKEVFLHCKKLDVDIVCLQETHSVVNDEVIWRSEWGGKIIFDHGESDARRVAIMINPNRNYEIIKYENSGNGHLIVAEINVNGIELSIVNVYAPNKDNPQFFVNLIEKVNICKITKKVIVVDFNLVLENECDAHNRKNNNDKATQVLSCFMEEVQFVDVFRWKYPDTKRFTYMQKAKKVYARLDYILCNYAMMPYIEHIKILLTYKSDHAGVLCKIEMNAGGKRGPGYWKLNDAILYDSTNVNEINKVIDQA